MLDYTATDIINHLVEAGIAGIVGNYSTDLVKSRGTKALELGRKIWQTISNRLKTDPDAKIIIDRVEHDKSEKHLKMLIPCLEEAMEDEKFTAELFQLLNQFVDVEPEKNINRDFTAKGSSAVLANATAYIQNIGGQHKHEHYNDSAPGKKF
ncbi:hypothetical protein [Pleurocapsa sp. FMAR1]|uniref:hypothetical protein n=1 Tax=Pleurocapsa sp. FMAR1 TaxID=3040204 RepID=UPI0029C696B3|nr:hypothetical protein [Pleurocapsa sp. FMAR1]